MNRIEPFDHPAWVAAAATAGGYVLVLFALFLLLFAVPYLVLPL